MYPEAGKPALIVFLRLPEKGKVKTRIAETLGEEAALDIYKKLASSTLKALSGLTCLVYLYFDPGLPDETNRLPEFIYRPQTTGDLGKKMAHAFEEVLQHHPSALLIGSDCPYLTADIIQQSFMALDECDAVLGPAVDGGYYLIGCHAVHPTLFENMPWGTNMVLPETIHQIQALRLKHTLLETLQDIDSADDWARYLQFEKESTGSSSAIQDDLGFPL